jgi:hypothetical protein
MDEKITFMRTEGPHLHNKLSCPKSNIHEERSITFLAFTWILISGLVVESSNKW